MKSLKSLIRELEQFIKKVERKSSTYPVDRIRVDSKAAGQFYIYDNDSQKWVYVHKDQMEYIKKIIQGEYEARVLKEACRQLAALKKFVSVYDEKFLANIYDKLHPIRKELVKPYDVTDEEYAKKWLDEKYERNPRAFKQSYPTVNKEEVRSKSEALIADRLKALGIPYRYECKLQLKDLIFYPDFTLLNKRTREEIIYEHFGMLDISEYANNFVKKIKAYTENGYILGHNLIATFETSDNPINMDVVEEIIKGSL